MQHSRRGQWDPHQNQLLPSDAMPRRLLDNSSFQFKLSQVYSQISQQHYALHQSQGLDGSKFPGATLPESHLDTIQNNSSISYVSPSQIQKPHQEAFLSYDFSVKHFGLLCDRNYLQHSEAFRSQKFGVRNRSKRVLTGGVKLDPIETQRKHNIPLNTYSIPVAKNNKITPYQSLEGWDDRTKVRKIVNSVSGRNVVISFLTFETYVKHQDAKKTRRAFYAANFTVLKYLLQFSKLEINKLFEKYAELVVIPSEKKKQQENIQLDFAGFEGIIEELRNNNGNNQQENENQEETESEWPKKSSQKSEKQDGVKYKIRYPTVELYVNDIRWKKVVQLTKAQIEELIQNNFASLPEYIKFFDEAEAAKLDPKVEEENTKEQEDQSEEIVLVAEESLKQEDREEKPKIGLPVDKIPLEEEDAQEEPKPLNFIIDNQKAGKPLAELLQQKQFKQIIDGKEYTLISFYPSKIRLKRIEVDHSQFITHNLTFQEFYELAALSKDQDILEYFQTKLRFFPELENQIIGDNPENEDVTVKRRSSFKKKIDLQLPPVEFDKNNLIEINDQCEEHGLIKEVEGTVELAGSTFSIKIEPPFFEVHYQEENRREIQTASISKLNEIFKRGFNFSFTAIE